MAYPKLADAVRLGRLAPPTGQVRAILDTDIANEIDDPFAIAHALLSPDRIHLEAITTAPFRREGLTAADSQHLSLELGRRTLAFFPTPPPLIRGADRFMESGSDLVDSPAVQKILQASHQGPLALLAIGAATNVAAALLADPTLVERVTVVWLGGHAPEFGNAWEYNLAGDRHASRVLLESGVPLVLFPAIGVTSHLLVSLAAMERDLESASPLGTFLTQLLREHVPNHFGYEKEIWDVGVTAWCIQPETMRALLVPTPTVDENLHWVDRPLAPLMRRITWLERNRILHDFFTKISQA